MAYGVNVGKEQGVALEKWKSGLQDLAGAASDFGGVEKAVGTMEGVYANAPAHLQQAQNQGILNMKQQAGNAAGMMAGRGGASNAMSSGAGMANSAAMSTGIGTFMNDIAAQKANMAVQGAQFGLQSQEMMHDYRLTKAETQNTINSQMIKEDYAGKKENANKLVIETEVQSLVNAHMLTGNDPEAFRKAVQQYAASFPPDIQASIYAIAHQQAASKGASGATVYWLMGGKGSWEE
jgi:hypothetical protein